MQVKKSILIISNKSSNLLLLLAVLADLEYKIDLQIDLVLNEDYTEIEINKVINCITYLLQINYSYHSFNIFIHDKVLLEKFKNCKEIQDAKKEIKIYTLMDLLNCDIVDNKGNLININKYKSIVNIKSDRVETFYDFQNLELKIG